MSDRKRRRAKACRRRQRAEGAAPPYDRDDLTLPVRARYAVLAALQEGDCDCGGCEPPNWIDAASRLEGASADDAWPAALTLAFAQFGDDAVDRAWQRGWMPQEMLGALRRRLDDEAVRAGVALMRGQLAPYTETQLSDRWRAQREALAEQTGAAGVAELSRGLGRWDRIVLWAAVLEALDLLEAVPAIPRIEPLPGSPAVSLGFNGAESSKVYERIRALLAKAESTDSDAEAETFTAKAQQLIARHSIDAALPSRADPGGREPEASRVLVERPYEQAKAALLAQIAQANHCRSVHWSEGGFTTLIGDRVDLRSVELLYNSLLVQATAAMTRAGTRLDAAGRPRTRSFRQSFLASFAHRIGERLQASADDATRAASEETGTDLVPVMRRRDERVDAKTGDLFPRLKAGRSMRITDYEGHVAGRAAADAARLGAEHPIASR